MCFLSRAKFFPKLNFVTEITWGVGGVHHAGLSGLLLSCKLQCFQPVGLCFLSEDLLLLLSHLLFLLPPLILELGPVVVAGKIEANGVDRSDGVAEVLPGGDSH